MALAEFIAESMKLVRLDLRENEIKTGGLMALSLALKVSQSVTRIDLDKGPKKESVSDVSVNCFDRQTINQEFNLGALCVSFPILLCPAPLYEY